MLDEVNAQHALKPDGRAPIAGFGIVRRDFIAQRSPGHQRLHGLEEFIAPRGFAVLFKARLRVGCHGKGLLLHGPVIYPGGRCRGNFFSIAFGLRRKRGRAGLVDATRHCVFKTSLVNSPTRYAPSRCPHWNNRAEPGWRM